MTATAPFHGMFASSLSFLRDLSRPSYITPSPLHPTPYLNYSIQAGILQGGAQLGSTRFYNQPSLLPFRSLPVTQVVVFCEGGYWRRRIQR